MTEIVQVQPRPFKFSLIHAALISACFAGPGLVWAHNVHQAEPAPGQFVASAGEYITDAEARAFVAEAGADTDSVVGDYGYPPIETARKVVLVGLDCGPDGKLLLVRESEEYPLDYIMSNCRDIQVR